MNFHDSNEVEKSSNAVVPTIYLITNGEMTDANFALQSTKTLELFRVAVESKIGLIQIREKKLSARNIFELTKRAVEITKTSKNNVTEILVNDRADIAYAAKAGGVHLTAKSLSAEVIRRNFPQNFIIGASCHAIEEVEKAKIKGANFATFSPIFQTPSKMQYGEPQGLEKLRRVCETAKDFHVIALGGINEANFKECLNVGAKGVAAIRLFEDAQNLPRIVKKIYGK